MKKHLLPYGLFVLIFSYGCKKDKGDELSPSITIHTPTQNQAFSMYDTVRISGHVSDETKLTYVSIDLSSISNAIYQDPVSLNVAGKKEVDFDIPYKLLNFKLKSGYYNISITAGDGQNSTQRNVKIYLTESPTYKAGYFVAGASDPNVYRYDSSWALKNTLLLNTGFNGMYFNAGTQELYVNGNINQPCINYSITTNAITSSIPYNGGGLPTFKFLTGGAYGYLGYHSGDVSRLPGAFYTYSTGNSSYVPYYFADVDNYAMGTYTDNLGGSDKIYAFRQVDASLIWGTFMPIRVVRILKHTNTEMYVLGNNGSNQGCLYLYDAYVNGLQGPFNLPSGKLLSAVEIDTDHLLLGMSDGNIYHYQFSNGNAIPVAGQKAQLMQYVPARQELTIAAGNSVFTYSVSSNYLLSQSGQNTWTDSIIALEVITNK